MISPKRSYPGIQRVVLKFDPEEAFRLLDEEMYNATYAIQEL